MRDVTSFQKAEAVFKNVFGRDFNDSAGDVQRMHFLMYIMNESGMTVGDYNQFGWRDESASNSVVEKK